MPAARNISGRSGARASCRNAVKTVAHEACPPAANWSPAVLVPERTRAAPRPSGSRGRFAASCLREAGAAASAARFTPRACFEGPPLCAAVRRLAARQSAARHDRSSARDASHVGSALRLCAHDATLERASSRIRRSAACGLALHANDASGRHTRALACIRRAVASARCVHTERGRGLQLLVRLGFLLRVAQRDERWGCKRPKRWCVGNA